ncbi:Alpha-pyrone synthesis polyketide synthase-like Pks18 [Caulifigura coniformis]|uniref:Alpha-pyrone synthesis polyketide synthase-like Pks18 n=1 Tax=Caulifigura coniformis TaxID=2527983 RepID=A0A517S8F5_9PLAN|nr:type III polyketide synthase [Caulifigura coniformis]QDT52414.1 Alpha-pyrone synthesis polyketide synthase-like Pks18 [Caulifigura coniformis]
MSTQIAGWGFALPEGRVTQTEAAEHAVAMWGEQAGLGSTIPALYRRTGVKSRHSVIVEAHGEGAMPQSFYERAVDVDDRGPTTAARMAYYEQAALGLAARAAAAALEDADAPATAITHLVTVSCSGFEAPGVDIGLVRALGLSPGVTRTNVGFMGCHGAFNGLRVAEAFAASDPKARVLVVCVELCSLHQQYSSDPQQIVANALFADGAAAILVQSGPRKEQWRLLDQCSLILPNTIDMMSWRIRDNGFEMTLSPAVPDLIRKDLQGWLESWLPRNGLSLGDLRSYAVHPGGPRILNAVVESLGLRAEALDASRSILADYGNMSSPTILFILNRLRTTGAEAPCLALAFGPGLTIEAALFGSGA